MIVAVVLLVSGGGVAYMSLTSAAEAPGKVAQRTATSPLPTVPTATTTPTPSSTPTPTPSRTVAPVRAWNSPDGWSIARPTGWRGARGESYTEWTRPGGIGHLGVQAIYSSTDPHQILRDAEETLKGQSDALRSLGRRAVLQNGAKAVEWEFTWTARAGGDAPGRSRARPTTRYGGRCRRATPPMSCPGPPLRPSGAATTRSCGR